MRERQEYQPRDQRTVTERVVPLYSGHIEQRVTPKTLLCLVLGAAERARIREATRGRQEVVFVERVGEVERLLAKNQCVPSALIVELKDRDGRATSELVRSLAARRPLIPVVAYTRSDAQCSGEIRELVVAGVHGLMFQGIDDSGIAFRSAVEGAQQMQVGERAAAAMTELLSQRVWSFVRHVTHHPVTQRVEDVAAALGHHRRTLVNQCALAYAPPPQQLLAWCRLAVVGALLENEHRTIESIALEIDFPSDTALRNMMKRYTGLRASDVRAAGGMDAVIRAFQIALATRGHFAGKLELAPIALVE